MANKTALARTQNQFYGTETPGELPEGSTFVNSIEKKQYFYGAGKRPEEVSVAPDVPETTDPGFINVATNSIVPFGMLIPGDNNFIGGGTGHLLLADGDDFSRVRYSAILAGYNNIINSDQYTFARGCVIAGGDTNRIDLNRSTISGGENNLITGSEYPSSGHTMVIAGGLGNVIDSYSGRGCVISGGTDNTISARGYNYGGAYNVISGGTDNTISGYGDWSGILGGKNNTVDGNEESFIIGSSITSDRDNCTFVNNLSIMDIPTSAPAQSGAVWNNGGVLTIVT